MPVFLMTEFIADLRTHADANFARRVLQKTLLKNGNFRESSDDHRYHGMDDVWIRYVSQGNSAYRVIYIRLGTNVYLYRAGEHAIEDRLSAPQDEAFDRALPIGDADGKVAAIKREASITTFSSMQLPIESPPNRFLRNNPFPDIHRTLFSRRMLPHSDIWLVAPYIDPALLQPTAQFGKLIFEQVEDGASTMLITAPPRKDQDIEWLEQLEERDVAVCFYPRLHSKLFCFVLDENRKYERGLPDASKLSSLLLVGSANLTAAGVALDTKKWNEELCYMIPEAELTHVETYVAELMMRGNDLKTARSFRARGLWDKLESEKW